MPRPAARDWKLFLVDDHPITRAGCVHLIATEADLKVVGEASGVLDAKQKLKTADVDIVLVDLRLEDGNGLDLVEWLSGECPELPILVWSARDESLYAERALQAGAKGFINKRALSNTLIQAIRTVLAGKTYLSEEAKDHLLSRRYNQTEQSSIASLSKRELEIFEFIGEGRTVKEIADDLCLASKTVNSYRDRIKLKLGVESSKELDRLAFQWTIEERESIPQEDSSDPADT